MPPAPILDTIRIPCQYDPASAVGMAITGELHGAKTIASATFEGRGAHEYEQLSFRVSGAPDPKFLVTSSASRSGDPILHHRGSDVDKAIAAARKALTSIARKGMRRSAEAIGNLRLESWDAVREAAIKEAVARGAVAGGEAAL